MKLNLTRKQELALIEIGINHLLRGIAPNTNETVETAPRKKRTKKSRRKWTPEQREKFKTTMQRKYGKRFTSK